MRAPEGAVGQVYNLFEGYWPEVQRPGGCGRRVPPGLCWSFLGSTRVGSRTPTKAVIGPRGGGSQEPEVEECGPCPP